MNLTPIVLSTDEISVLQLGLGFCPTDPIHVTETIKDLYLFARNLTFKFIFDEDRHNISLERELTERTKDFTMDEFRALRDLMLLYDEGCTDDSPAAPTAGTSGVTSVIPEVTVGSSQHGSTKSKKFKPTSRKFPDLMTCPAIWAFLQQTIKDLKRSRWQSFHPNLTSNQQKALCYNDVMILLSNRLIRVEILSS